MSALLLYALQSDKTERVEPLFEPPGAYYSHCPLNLPFRTELPTYSSIFLNCFLFDSGSSILADDRSSTDMQTLQNA